MARYSVAAAKDNLSSLIAKAEAGEEVIITRHGNPVAELHAKGERTPCSVEQATERLRRRVAGDKTFRVPLENFRAWLYDNDGS